MTDRDEHAPDEANGTDDATRAIDAGDLEEADNEDAEAREAALGEDGDEAEDDADEQAEAEECRRSRGGRRGGCGSRSRGGRGAAGRGRRPGRHGSTDAERAPTPSEIAVHIDDRISKVFVVGVALVFALIFANASAVREGRGADAGPHAAPDAHGHRHAGRDGGPVWDACPVRLGDACRLRDARPVSHAGRYRMPRVDRPSATAMASETPAETLIPSVTPAP